LIFLKIVLRLRAINIPGRLRNESYSFDYLLSTFDNTLKLRRDEAHHTHDCVIIFGLC